MRAPPRPVAFLAALALAVGAAACTEPAAVDGGADVADRIATVRELRATVGPPAADVGTAAATLREVLDGLHADPTAAPDARRGVVETVRERDLARLEEATAALAATELPEAGPGAPDVAAASAARDDVVRAATDLATAAAEDLDLLVTSAGAEDRLAELTAAWDEPGSRSQQLERLDTTAEAADELAAELEAIADVPACAELITRRADAARTVATHTRELRDLVEQRAGTGFDERRAELANDPYGLGERLVDGDVRDLGCWRTDGPVAAAADEVEEGLAALEEALNPADLEGSGG